MDVCISRPSGYMSTTVFYPVSSLRKNSTLPISLISHSIQRLLYENGNQFNSPVDTWENVELWSKPWFQCLLCLQEGDGDGVLLKRLMKTLIGPQTVVYESQKTKAEYRKMTRSAWVLATSNSPLSADSAKRKLTQRIKLVSYVLGLC